MMTARAKLWNNSELSLGLVSIGRKAAQTGRCYVNLLPVIATVHSDHRSFTRSLETNYKSAKSSVNVV